MGQLPATLRGTITIKSIQYKGLDALYPVEIHATKRLVRGNCIFYLRPCLIQSNDSVWSQERLKLIMEEVKERKKVSIEYEVDSAVLWRVNDFDLWEEPKNE